MRVEEDGSGRREAVAVSGVHCRGTGRRARDLEDRAIVNCQNCNASLAGAYCSDCGQKAVDVNRPLRELVHEGLESLTAFDSRVLRTFWPLIRRPGFLTIEYLEGRRARYVPPFKLYLFVSFVLFLTLGFAKVDLIRHADDGESSNGVVLTLNDAIESKQEEPPKEGKLGNQKEGTPTDPASTEVELSNASEATEESGGEESFLGIDLEDALENETQLEANFVSRLAQIVFLLVPAFAALLHLVYWRSGRLYIQHLIFSLHVHTLAFLVAWLKTMLGFGPEILGKLGEWLLPAVLVYVYLAMKRVYGQGWLKTLLKMLVLWILHLLVLAVVFFAAFLLAASMA